MLLLAYNMLKLNVFITTQEELTIYVVTSNCCDMDDTSETMQGWLLFSGC